MQFTTTGKIVIGLVVAALLGFLYYKFAPEKGQIAEQTQSYTSPEPSSSTSSDNSATSSSASSGSSSSSSDNATSVASDVPAFSYKAPEPVNGKLKGVVELGASGFNSFIVKIDKQKNWKLEKADFGNSLVIENMASDDDIRIGLKKYIAGMLDYGVSGRDIHFVVSSGALKSESTPKIIAVLKKMNYMVNTVTPEQEGKLGLNCVLPAEFESKAFVTDIGSGNTKIAWKTNGTTASVEAPGAKYFEKGMTDEAVATEVSSKAKQIPASKTQLCFIIGGVPFELAKEVRKGKERYTVLNVPDSYKPEKAKGKAGVNIYKAVADATGCKQFVFDWDANFTIGFLLGLP
jgi:hypothetical protein